MPCRRPPLITHEVYHVLNKAIAGEKIFINRPNCQRFLNALAYYRQTKIPVSFAKFMTLEKAHRASQLKELERQEPLVEIISYCLMPNHFHLLLQQTLDGGISHFMSNLSNSFVRFFNIKRNRKGPLFQARFKSVRIESDEQLCHVIRYIHLNPYTSRVVRRINDLTVYPYSSLPDYLGRRDDQLLSGMIKKSWLLDLYQDTASFEEFTFDQADYQRELAKIKRLALLEG